MVDSKAVKIGVVLTDLNDWTVNTFLMNIRKRGAKAISLKLSRFSAEISSDGISIFDFARTSRRGGGKFEDLELDAILVRDVGASPTLEEISFKFDLLRQIRDSGMLVLNTPSAIQNAANKFYSFCVAKHMQLPLPRTLVTSDLEIALRGVEEFGEAILKPIFGSKGVGIVKFDSSQSKSGLELNLRKELEQRRVLYLQEFVPHTRDIRVFVVGEEAVGAIYRFSQNDAIVSNLSQGGVPVKCELTEEMCELAIRSAKAIGADFAGVDLIEGREGLELLEVNATPSGRGIKLACNLDVTERIIDLLFERI